MWFEALERWAVDPSSWDTEKLGPPLDQPNHRIPRDIAMRFSERLRKRLERQRDREAAAARQAEADRQLRNTFVECMQWAITRLVCVPRIWHRSTPRSSMAT